LGLRAAPKERAEVSAAEVVYSKQLCLPQQFTACEEADVRPQIPEPADLTGKMVFVERPAKRPKSAGCGISGKALWHIAL
jgi:hypothetical protein